MADVFIELEEGRLQHLLDVRSLDLLERLLEREPFDQTELHIGDRLAIAQFHTCHEQVAHVKDASPYLGHAAVNSMRQMCLYPLVGLWVHHLSVSRRRVGQDIVTFWTSGIGLTKGER